MLSYCRHGHNFTAVFEINATPRSRKCNLPEWHRLRSSKMRMWQLALESNRSISLQIRSARESACSGHSMAFQGLGVVLGGLVIGESQSRQFDADRTIKLR